MRKPSFFARLPSFLKAASSCSLEEFVVLVELLPVSHLLLPHGLQVMSGHHLLLLQGHVLSFLLVDRNAEELLILSQLVSLSVAAVTLLLRVLCIKFLVHVRLLEAVFCVHLHYDILSLFGAEVRFVILAVHSALVGPIYTCLFHLHRDK